MKQFATATAILALSAAPALADHHGDKAMMKDGHAVKMEQIDVNQDGRIDFTEFSNHFETNHGWSAADSATEYVRLIDDSGTMDEAALARISLDGKVKDTMTKTQVDIDMMDGEVTTTTTTTSMSGDMMVEKTETTTGTMDDMAMTAKTSMEPSLNGTPVTYDGRYGTFGDYDGNTDGKVSFAEYSAYRSKSDVTMTAAAQEFMRITGGSSDFDQARFDTAMRGSLIERPTYGSR